MTSKIEDRLRKNGVKIKKYYKWLRWSMILEYISPGMVPVILVTAKGAVQDKVLGLRSGAEDYIVKPFDLEELLARVETVLRRYHKMERYFEIGTLKVDTLSHLVYRDGQAVLLAKKEYDLLLYL